MVKTVSSGERITTVTLEGDECEVVFSRGFNVFEISNQSDGDVLMSLQSGATEGDDGAITVAQGKAFTYKHMRNLDRLYLTGTGAVVVVAANDTNNSFNRGSEGGDGDYQEGYDDGYTKGYDVGYEDGGGGAVTQLGIYPVGTDGRPAGDVTVPEGVTSLYRYIFDSDTVVTSVKLPSTLTTLNTYVFNGCTNLTNVDYGDTSVTSLPDRCFYGCTSLTDTGLGSNTTVTSLGTYCFNGCTSLTDTGLGTNTTVTSLNPSCFYDCTSLADTGLGTNTTVTSLGNFCFYNCASLEKVVLSDYVTSVGSSVFQRCTALKNVRIPASAACSYYTSTSTTNPFYGCTALEDIQLGEGWNKSLYIPWSDNITHDSMVAMFENLADLTDSTACTLTLGSTNLAKLTDEEMAVATNKNWTLA